MAVADRSLPAGTVAITGALYMDELKAEIEKLWGISTTNLGTVVGTNTITAVADPAITAYVDGQKFLLPVAASNTTAATLNINSVGAKAILDSAGAAISSGALVIGNVVLLVYRTADNGFRILTSSSFAAQKVNTQESTDATGAWVWTKPAGYLSTSRVLIEILGNGGSGGSRAATGNAGGAGGGGYLPVWCKLSDLSATETGTIPAPAAGVSGDSAGNSPANLTFTMGAKTLSMKPGIGGGHGVIGFGGLGGSSGKPTPISSISANMTWPLAFSAGASPSAAPGGPWGAGGGTSSTADVPGPGGDSISGGGGGGSSSSTAGGTRSGGVSILAGDGGAGGAFTGGAGGAGSYPGGGGGGAVQGGTSGAGARGRIRVSVYP